MLAIYLTKVLMSILRLLLFYSTLQTFYISNNQSTFSQNYTESFFYSYFFVTAMCFIYDIRFSYITHLILFYAHTCFWSMFLFSIPQNRFVCFRTIALRLFQSRWIIWKVSVYGGTLNAWFTHSFNFVF